MDDASSEALLVNPFLLTSIEFILSIGEIIIHFVTPNDLQKMQQEDIDYHLREDNDK